MYISFFNRVIIPGLILFLSALSTAGISSLQASELSDASQLRQKCEAEYNNMEVAVKNFGNNYVKQYYRTAAELIRDGKIKLAQSKYQDSISIYNKVLLLYKDIYKELTADYIRRTEMIYNDTAVELVDFIDVEKVSQYFRLANQNIVDAKKAASDGNYILAIDTCRASKKYSFASYTAAGKPVPDKYKKDVKDNNKELE